MKTLCTFVIIYRSVILAIRKFCDIIYRENQNTHLMFNNCFPKIVNFVG
jgi:hypothetical protein